MPEIEKRERKDSELFAAVCQELLQCGLKVRFCAEGESMRPNILNKDSVLMEPAASDNHHQGDVVMTKGNDGIRVHRIVRSESANGEVVTRGDSGQENDPATSVVMGKVISIERNGREEKASGKKARLIHDARGLAHRIKLGSARRFKKVSTSLSIVGLLTLFALLVGAAPASAVNVTLTQTVSSTTVGPTQTYTYTITVTNNSFVTAVNKPTITQVVPAGAGFQSAVGTGFTCTGPAVGSAGTVSCVDSVNLNANSTTNAITVTVTVNAGTAPGTVLSGAAKITSTTALTGTTTATTNVTVVSADLSVAQTVSPATVAPRGLLTFTETITNNGPSSATVPQLTFNTPANTTFVSETDATGTCTDPGAGNTGAVTCNSTADLANAGTQTITIVVATNAGLANGTVITGTSTVSSTTYDPNNANNSATSSATVGFTDMAVTQTASASAVAANSTITFTQTVVNNGPAFAPNALVYQQTPANTVFASVTPPAGWTCGTTPAVGATGQIICSDGTDFPAATPVTFTYVVTVNAGTASGTTIVNTVDATSSAADSDGTNNTATTSVLVETTGQSDIAVSMGVSPTPVFIASALTYTIQVQNLGLATATGVAVTDAIPTGTTFSSVSAPGATCVGTATVVCTFTSLASGASGTITLKVKTPATAGTLTNTASTNLPGDPVAANNSATAITVVQPLVCATPGKDGTGGSLNSVVNTYYPPSAIATVAAAGSTSVGLGAISAGSGTTPIAIGDLLLIIQMQDALINSTNTSAYGDGSPGDPGSGYTNLNNTGNFEFVTATSAVPTTGGTLNFKGTGPTGGLLNTYTNAAPTGTQGQRRFQVIRVPQYTTATLASGLAAYPWDGSTGGVVALDVASQLTLGGPVSVNGVGFRGGAGRKLTGGTGAATDYVGSSAAGDGSSKGEGIAGTPRYLANSSIAAVIDTTVEGLPGGSYLRGAPGNAGGGATDGTPNNNAQNTGGGAGANGGAGGEGGFGWIPSGNPTAFSGGFGGVVFPASTGALVMGGGGGAGTTNDGTADPANTNPAGINSSGAAGGGIVIIHVGSVTGTGTITANGQAALHVLNDGGGGGGAAGSIRFLANSGTLTGLTVQANGGTGGNTWASNDPGTTFTGVRHGPGGGGGGGVIELSSAATASSVNGAANGITTTARDSYGASPGQVGFLTTSVTIPQTPGVQPGSECAGADLSITNAGTPNPVAPNGTITYTQTVTNNGPLPAVNAVFSEAVPANTTFSSITPPAGWTCNSNANILSTGVITCTNPLVANAASGSFSVAVTVNSGTTFGSQIVDVANVTSGTNDPNLSNNTATAINIVGSATSAYLTLTKTAASPSVVAGSNITFTMVITNNGPAAAVNAGIFDTVPTNTTFVSIATPGGASCGLPPVGGTGNISCTVPTLANGATSTYVLVVQVTAGTPNGTVISNTASANATTPNPNPTGATATATVIVAGAAQADLGVTSSASPNPVLIGNNITFTETVTNNGPGVATGAVFTDVVPTGTTFVSLVAPAGWTCGTPAVGATGTITCTNASVAVGASASFPIVVNVNSTTAAGTVITDTATLTTTSSDPNSANNTASSSTVVASPTQADVTIAKTAAPEPVDQGTNLTYTIQVTNNGPAVAQGVSVSDPIPAQVTYVSSSTTQGSCTQSAGTVTCPIGAMSVGQVVVITINVTASSFTSSTVTCNGQQFNSCNTATVTTTTSNPNPTPSSSAGSTLQAPTAVQLSSFKVVPRPEGGVVVEWHTREEIRNLGFHVYREDAQGRHRLNPSIIAGGALFVRGGSPQHSAKTYQWLDPEGSPNASYWLEDVDLNGTRTTHGPAQFETSSLRVENSALASTHAANALLLTQLNRSVAVVEQQAQRLIFSPQPKQPEIAVGEYRVSLESQPAVKIGVRSEGWYRVTYSQLLAAGYEQDAEARNLQLYAEGIEQPILIRGPQSGKLGPDNSIEFYGTGIDTPYSDTRVYWLVKGSRPGKRIAEVPAATSGSSSLESFPFTSLHEDRTTYLAILLNGEDKDNFFGAAVTSEPVDQDVTVAHSDPVSGLPVSLDVTLQGVTDAQVHRVSVSFNGASLGEMDFSNQTNATQTFSLDPSQLHDGVSTVTLTALEGDNDVSLVQSIQLHYAHTYAADSNWLRAEAPAGATVHFTGFTNPQVRVFDVTDARSVVQLNGNVRLENGVYGATVALQNQGPAQRALLAFSEDKISSAASLAHHQPTYLSGRPSSTDMVIISHPDFVSALTPLVKLRESEGRSVFIATIEQIFDAFNYGERSPYAVRNYLQSLAVHNREKLQAVLFVGDASVDPRNYLGFGDFDFVPTRIIQTDAFKTASDDWFTDFRQTGFATIPTGRLPVRTVADATLTISKIVEYSRGSYNGSWNRQALLIADQNVGNDFTSETLYAGTSLPGGLSARKIFADGQDPNTIRQQIVNEINSGALLVNYMGHGSTGQWSFANIFDNEAAANLSNQQRLPVFLLMDCLNGFFHDVYTESLAESLLLAPHGGAVAVWASSGFTNAPPQASLDQAFLRALKLNPAMTIGRAALHAKLGITDKDVRRTWILFGDPSMTLQFTPTSATPTNPGHPPQTGFPPGAPSKPIRKSSVTYPSSPRTE